MLSAHPFLHIHNRLPLATIGTSRLIFHFDVALNVGGLSAGWSILSRGCILGAILEVRPEVLQECDFLLEFLGEVEQGMSSHNVLLLGWRDGLTFIVVKDVLPVRSLRCKIKNNFRGVIEKDSGSVVRQEVAKTILRRIVHPLLDPHTRALERWNCANGSLYIHLLLHLGWD